MALPVYAAGVCTDGSFLSEIHHRMFREKEIEATIFFDSDKLVTTIIRNVKPLEITGV